MNQKPEIAIIEPNTLTALGLKSILEKIIPMAVIRTFHNFGELVDDTPDMYAHYFIAAQIYVEHNTFFLPRKKKTIVLAGESQPFQLSAVRTLNIYQPEESLVNMPITTDIRWKSHLRCQPSNTNYPHEKLKYLS